MVYTICVDRKQCKDMSESRDTKKWLTMQQVADALEVHHSTVSRMVKRGDLPAVKVGKQYRIDPAQLEAYIRVNTTAPPIEIVSGDER